MRLFIENVSRSDFTNIYRNFILSNSFKQLLKFNKDSEYLGKYLEKHLSTYQLGMHRSFLVEQEIQTIISKNIKLSDFYFQ